MSNRSENTLTEKEFVLRAIARLRDPKYKGIHAVYSGFNKAFAEYFGTDPVEAVKRLEQERVLVTRIAKGGAIIYDANDAPKSVIAAKQVLPKITAAPRPTTLERILE
jgi:hypothetical protein